MTAHVVAAAPAKINLCLGVGPVRDDGYHPLATVYQAIGIVDDVRVRPAEQMSLTISSERVDVSAVPTDATNLAWRAAELLARHHGIDESVAIHIHKRIPVAGGLAGGSTDAAAALVACDALWGLGTPRDDLLRLAARLGSDVPFCVGGGTAIGGGRGELVTPVMTRGTYWWVVVPDADGLSTPAVYAEFDRHGGAVAPEVSHELLAALRAGDPAMLGPTLSNDLQPAALALRPDLQDRLTQGVADSALAGIISGSGPTTVFLCASAEHAADVADALEELAGDIGVFVAEGPVHGARVIAG
ncbi:MAG: 4-(cytidine 5'-diphospho)-2-C-methyl-D-erythritol kinase [Nocardioidaceae bacterium]